MREPALQPTHGVDRPDRVGQPGGHEVLLDRAVRHYRDNVIVFATLGP